MTRADLYALFEISWLLPESHPAPAPAIVETVPGNGLFKGEPQ